VCGLYGFKVVNNIQQKGFFSRRKVRKQYIKRKKDIFIFYNKKVLFLPIKNKY